MQLVNELENELAFAVLQEGKNGEKLQSEDVLLLIDRIREILEPISERDHSYSEELEKSAAVSAES